MTRNLLLVIPNGTKVSYVETDVKEPLLVDMDAIPRVNDPGPFGPNPNPIMGVPIRKVPLHDPTSGLT